MIKHHKGYKCIEINYFRIPKQDILEAKNKELIADRFLKSIDEKGYIHIEDLMNETRHRIPKTWLKE